MHHLDLPVHIATAIVTTVGTVVAMASTGISMILGEIPIPNPTDAGQWSFYGVLIVGICILGTALGWLVRWVLTKFIAELEANRVAREKSNQVLERLCDSIDRQQEWNEEQGRDALRRFLGGPVLPPPSLPQDPPTVRSITLTPP